MTPVLLSDLAGGLAAVALYGSMLWASYVAAARLVGRDASAAVRLAAVAVTTCWLSAALFWLLVPFELLRLPVALALCLALAAALQRLLGRHGTPLGRLREDLGRVRDRLAALARTAPGWALGALAGVAAVRTLRGTASPPLGWDALTYHFYKAGRWVQLGDFAPQPAPDAWQYYEYYPVLGDVFWAWAMLPIRSDALVTAAALAVWCGLFLGVYATARELDATPERAALAGGAVCALPSVLPYLSSGYVDNTVAALFALGALFTVRVWQRGALREAPLAVGALALMVGAKLTSAAFFALATALVTIAVLRSGAGSRTRRLVLLACLAAAVAGYPSYQRAWLEQGSPFHPFRIVFGDLVLSEGVQAAGLAEEIRSWPGYQLESAGAFWHHFFLGTKGSGGYLNPGPGGLLVVGIGLLGAVVALRDPRRRVVGSFLVLCALLMTTGFLSGNMETFRTTLKVTTAGRYVTIGLVAMAMVGAAWPGRLARALWGIALLAGVVLSLPQGWAAAEAPAVLGTAAVAAAVAVGLAVSLWWWRRTGRRILPAAAAVLVAVAGLAALEPIRGEHRYAIYEAAADPVDPVFHMHPLHARYASAWPLWQALDGPAPHRLAVTAGWDRLGHNWYRYPLLGSRLQNQVLYVPVTADGGIVDYRELEEVARRASFAAWLERLVEAEVDHVVSLAPRLTIEDFWMRRAPALFEPAVAERHGLHVAYRFDREAAREALRQAAERRRE